jgi:hypothetical protein
MRDLSSLLSWLRETLAHRLEQVILLVPFRADYIVVKTLPD